MTLFVILLISGIGLIWLAHHYYENFVQYTGIREFEETEEFYDWLSDLKSVDEIVDWAARNINYISDKELWGVSDYWSTPLETFEMRAGDCESQHIFISYCIWRRFGYRAFLVIVRKSYLQWPWILHGVSAYRGNLNNQKITVINYGDKIAVPELNDSLPYIKDGVSTAPYVKVTAIYDIKTGKRIRYKEA